MLVPFLSALDTKYWPVNMAHPEVIHMSWKRATRQCAPDEREGRLARIAPVK
jgi:hypothetical protein